MRVFNIFWYLNFFFNIAHETRFFLTESFLILQGFINIRVYFGDEIEDAVTNGEETVRLSTLLRDKAGYRYMEDLGTKPRVYYLPPVDRLFPFDQTKNENKES